MYKLYQPPDCILLLFILSKWKLHAKSGGLCAWDKSERKRMPYRGGKEKGYNNEFLSMEQ